MLVIALFLYSIVALPLLLMLLSKRYYGKYMTCWAQPLSELRALIIRCLPLALSSGITLIALGYSLYAVWGYMLLRMELVSASEESVQTVLSHLYGLVISLPAIVLGGIWSWILWQNMPGIFRILSSRFYKHHNS